MGIAERREREKEQRRSDIIDAAESVFFARGVAESTMDDVAAAAELSKGTIYLYFRNKEDLYLAIVQRGMAILQGMFEAAARTAGSGLDRIRAIGRAYFEFHRTYTEYFDAMLYFESYTYDPNSKAGYAVDCAEQSNALFAICADVIQAGIEDGSIRDDVNPMTLAVTLYGASTGLAQILAMKGDMIEQYHAVDAGKLIESFFELVERSLVP